MRPIRTVVALIAIMMIPLGCGGSTHTTTTSLGLAKPVASAPSVVGYPVLGGEKQYYVQGNGRTLTVSDLDKVCPKRQKFVRPVEWIVKVNSHRALITCPGGTG